MLKSELKFWVVKDKKKKESEFQWRFAIDGRRGIDLLSA